VDEDTPRRPAGGVYYTLNELAIAAYDGTYEGMAGEALALGAKVGGPACARQHDRLAREKPRPPAADRRRLR
jgi:hypothetical protein